MEVPLIIRITQSLMKESEDIDVIVTCPHKPKFGSTLKPAHGKEEIETQPKGKAHLRMLECSR